MKKALAKLKDAVSKRLALLSDRTNPVEDELDARQFKSEKIWFWINVACAAFGIAMAVASRSAVNSVLSLFNMACMYISYSSMLAVKKTVYARKLYNVSDGFTVPYEEAVLRLAVVYPGLPPPNMDGYEKVRKKAERP